MNTSMTLIWSAYSFNKKRKDKGDANQTLSGMHLEFYFAGCRGGDLEESLAMQ